VEAVEQYASKRFIEPEFKRIQVDMEIEPDDINQHLLDEIEMLRPNGAGNPVPCFVLRSNRISKPVRVGTSRAHLKFSTGPNKLDSIMFNCADINESTLRGCSQDLLFELGQNDFGGKKSLQLKIKDVRSTFLESSPSKENNNSVRLTQAVKRAVEETGAGHPVLFVYPAYRSLIKHLAVMEYFLNGHNVRPLHGHLGPEDRSLAQNELAGGNSKVFLITRSFLQYFQKNIGLPDNLRYVVRMWPSSRHDDYLSNHPNREIETLELAANLVLYRSAEIPDDRGQILVYANQPQTVRQFTANYPEISVECGISDMSQRRAVRRKYTSSVHGIMLSDGTHTAGCSFSDEIKGMILADSPLGSYEIAAFTDYLRTDQEIKVGVAFNQNSLAVNRRYLDRLYPDLETVNNVLQIFMHTEDSGRGIKMDRLISRINGDGSKQYTQLEIQSVLRILADLDLCRFEKSGNIRGIYSKDNQKLVSNICNTPYYLEGLAEKQILADWEIELNNALVW
jgi:single-stranded-DNA-specific exonuclease